MKTVNEERMVAMDKIEFLSMSKSYEVHKQTSGYEVYQRSSDLEAFISTAGDIQYYIGGVTNRVSESAPIELDKLQELVKFCELMVK